MKKKLTKQEMAAILARRAARKSAFPPSPPRQLSRKEARTIAHFNMQRAGVTHINRKNQSKESFFSTHWREWIVSKRQKVRA